MRAIIEGNETQIRRLRVTSNERDVLALRLHLDRILGSADLKPAGLPSGAVMCIRNLRVSTRTPLELRESRFADEWKASIATSLDQLVMRAARPAREAVPLDARAVIFLDRAELLACLASDWGRGLVLARWWWQGLFRNQSASQVVKDSWRAAPEYVPAALAQLARKDVAHKFVHEWSNNESLALLQNVLTTFALQDLLPVIELARNADHDGQRASAIRSFPPWQRWAPEASESGLGVGQQLLLSIGLLIQRAPAVVRTRDFARSVKDWHEHISADDIEDAAENVDARAIREPEPSLASADRDIEIDSLDFDSPVAAPQPTQPSRTAESLVKERATAPDDLQETRSDVSAGISQRETPSAAQSGIDAPGDATADVEAVVGLRPMYVNESDHMSRLDLESDHSVEQNALSQESELQDSSDLAGKDVLETSPQFETQLGGLFYLVNLGLYLNLYGDFTTPRAAGIELNVWDFVALVGKELVGGDDDPVWPFLAQLAGREAEDAPGAGFMPESDWRIAPEWLADFSKERQWRWNASEGRLRLAHPEGFLVLDLALDLANSDRQLREEIEKYEAALGHSIQLRQSAELLVDAGLETIAPQASPQLREWLARLMPYVRARLRVAFGLAADAAVGAKFCRRQAAVRATDTHVDIFFSLADLPLEIRFAGLDRDPGWVPAAGRFIAFHFD